jgi:hypothetical protein
MRSQIFLRARLGALTTVLSLALGVAATSPVHATPFGDARSYGSAAGRATQGAVVAMAATPNGRGYWLVASDGGVFAFGDARSYGSAAGRLKRPIVSMARSTSGRGYWLVASDGGVFAFGDAGYYGSTGHMRLNRPIVSMARTVSGRGYWLVASDGGIFSFGDARYYGSTGHKKLNRPIVAIARTRSGRGYSFVASDGGIFSFGDARYFGSTGNRKLNRPIVGMARTASGRGYWLVASDGGVFASTSSSTATGGCSGSSCRPYDPRSPWNTPISANAAVDAKSSTFMRAISDNGLPLSSNVDQYSVPVYHFNAQTPRQTVHLSGYFSTYDSGDAVRIGHGFAPSISGVQIPSGAVQSAGSDGQIVIWDPESGVEYAFWQFGKNSAGQYVATNGYRYHTTTGYNGRFADGNAGRGAGTTYLAGLVRPWEIAQGRIDHALAFAYAKPSSAFRYPASKSDGRGVLGTDLPEGARLQLNPALTDADFARWGLSRTARVIARALQRYGMYVIDNSGSSKIYLEDRRTAHWPADVNANTVRSIPWSQFKVLAPS